MQTFRLLSRGLTALAFTFLVGAVAAHEFTAGQLTIDNPRATPSRPGVKSSGVFINGIVNAGDKADRLVGASTPAAARVEVHEMKMVDDVMRMREIVAIELPAGETTSMSRGSPGGYHLMLMEMPKPVAVGEKFPLTLQFEQAGMVEVEVTVEEIKTDSVSGRGVSHEGHGMSHGGNKGMEKK